MVDNHKLDLADVCDFAIAVEGMYNVQVILELQPVKERKKYLWRAVAKARRTDGNVDQELVAPRICLYPSADHGTFAGAAFRAVHDLEQALQAQWSLQQLPLPFDDL